MSKNCCRKEREGGRQAEAKRKSQGRIWDRIEREGNAGRGLTDFNFASLSSSSVRIEADREWSEIEGGRE